MSAVVHNKGTRFVGTVVSIAVVAVLVRVAFSAAGGEQTPELAFIEGVIANETEAIDAIRRFDQAQLALASWDIDNARTLDANGDSAGAEESAGSARRRVGMVDQAYRVFLRAYPDNARGLSYHGELLYDHFDDPVTALKNWHLATSLDRTLSAPHNNLGLHYCHVGSYQKGLRSLDKALELDSDHADYQFNMAQIYLVHGPQVEKIRGWDKKRVYREAMKHSKRAAELAPDDYELRQDYAVNFFAAENYGVEADWKEAAVAWSAAREKARNQTEEFYTWLNEARVWIEHDDTKRAEPCLDAALAIIPESGVALSLLKKVQEQGD